MEVKRVAVRILRNNNFPTINGYKKMEKTLDGSDLNIANGQFIPLTRKVIMNNIDSDLGLILISAKRKFVAHIAPTKTKINETADELEYIVDSMRREIKTKDGDVFAFVTGCVNRDSGNKLANDSMDMENAILTTLEDAGVETTAVTEKHSTGINSSFNLFSFKDNIILWDGIMSKIRKTLHAEPEEIKNELSTHFDNVVISPNADVNIIDSMQEIVSAKNTAK